VVPVLEGKRVVGVDPERRNLVNFAWKDEAGVIAFSRFTDNEFQAMIGLRQADRKMQPRQGADRAVHLIRVTGST
jgi:hypothetical protein